MYDSAAPQSHGRRLGKRVCAGLVGAAAVICAAAIWMYFGPDQDQRRAVDVIYENGGIPSYVSTAPKWAKFVDLDAFVDRWFRLEGADFSGTAIHDHDLRRLTIAVQPLDDFKWLRLRNTDVTAEGIAELENALPNVDIQQ